LNRKQRLLSYFLVTNFVWGMYLVWLIPFQLIVVGLNWDQFITWIVLGTIAEFFVAYIIAKACVRYIPRIEKWVEVKFPE